MIGDLIRIKDSQIIWPYSLGRLRIDEPSKSFSNSPSDNELEYYGCFRINRTNKPEFDPFIEKAIEVHPVEVDGKWIQKWEIVELSAEEKEDYYRQTHPPQWIFFNNSLPPEVDRLLIATQSISPRLALALGVGLGKASDGDIRVFISAWQTCRDLGLISDSLIVELQSLGVTYNLPVEFISGLGSTKLEWNWPENPVRFQKWTSPDGGVWVYDQPRNPNGTYVTDNPETPENESTIRWILVEMKE